MSVEVTVKDDVDGSVRTIKVDDDDYFIVYGPDVTESLQVYPKTGTHQITIKGVGRGGK